MAVQQANLPYGANDHSHALYWRWLIGLLAIPFILVAAAGYAVPGVVATNLVSAVTMTAEVQLLPELLSRFSGYSSPHNALLAVMVSWLTSPLPIISGYIFTTRIIEQHIIHVAPESKLLQALRILAGMVLLAGVAYATIFLPGVSGARCDSCEETSMGFMLLVCIVGLWCTGHCWAQQQRCSNCCSVAKTGVGVDFFVPLVGRNNRMALRRMWWPRRHMAHYAFG